MTPPTGEDLFTLFTSMLTPPNGEEVAVTPPHGEDVV